MSGRFLGALLALMLYPVGSGPIVVAETVASDIDPLAWFQPQHATAKLLLLIGAGHVPILRHAAAASPEIDLIDVSEVLE